MQTDYARHNQDNKNNFIQCIGSSNQEKPVLTIGAIPAPEQIAHAVRMSSFFIIARSKRNRKELTDSIKRITRTGGISFVNPCEYFIAAVPKTSAKFPIPSKSNT
jgi:hypothetical protein